MPEFNYGDRITFDAEHHVMEVDFSDLTFVDTRQVNAFYDEVERQIAATGEHWYFLVNYRNCRIDPLAWVAFAHRGKMVNVAYSLGSVRYAAPDAEKKAIQQRSKTEQFDANLFESREAAFAHLMSMQNSAAA